MWEPFVTHGEPINFEDPVGAHHTPGIAVSNMTLTNGAFAIQWQVIRDAIFIFVEPRRSVVSLGQISGRVKVDEMVSSFLTRFAGRLGGLVFVTSAVARDRFGDEIIEWLGQETGGRVLVLEQTPPNIYAAVNALRERLPAVDTIQGVVILGNYEEMPARAIQVISSAELEAQKEWNTNKEFDLDVWRVWNDDLYGTFQHARLPSVPVSRVPVVPKVWLADDGWEVIPDRQGSFGMRSHDFAFADSIHASYLLMDPQVAMGVTPPPVPLLDLVGSELGADRFYLMLHSMSDRGSTYKGASEDGLSSSVAVDLDGFGARSAIQGAGLSGACWGALVASLPSTYAVDGKLRPREAHHTIALTLIDRGATAIVGFTGQHYVPDNSEPPDSFGALLHRYFWANVAGGETSAARALYQARVQYVRELAPRPLNILARSIARKTLWSATCLGLGW